VAVEAIKAHKTAAQIAQMFGVHPTQVGGWKKQALAGLPDIFGNGREQLRQQADSEKDELYKQIGPLKVELDFLKKLSGAAEPYTCWTRNSRHMYAGCAGRNGRSLFWCSVNPSKNMVWGGSRT
jgi:transposase